MMWLVAGPVSAEIYKWTDEKGYIHYSDKKPENQEVTELKFEIATWCSVCKKAKRKYKQLGATGVPVIIVGRKRMNGFSEAGFKRIYK